MRELLWKGKGHLGANILTCSLWLNYGGHRSTWLSRTHIEGAFGSRNTEGISFLFTKYLLFTFNRLILYGYTLTKLMIVADRKLTMAPLVAAIQSIHFNHKPSSIKLC